MSDRSDLELMAAVRDGELECARHLYERHRDRLLTFFQRMTQHRGASEDAVQEVFLRILRSRHTFRNEGRFDAWMYTIARNVLRDRAGRDSRLVPVEPASEEYFEEDTAHARLERREELDRLGLALSRMPSEQREVLILSRASGLTHRELGELLGCSAAAVKLRVHRALTKLRSEYRKQEERVNHGT